MKKLYSFLAISLFPFLLFCQSKPNQNIVKGEVVVRFQPGTNAESFIKQFNSSQNTDFQLFIKKIILPDWNYFLLKHEPSELAVDVVIEKLQNQTAIKNVYSNVAVTFRGEPNDPEYYRQWNLERILAPEIWKITTGGVNTDGDTIVVAVIDSGFDVAHTDLIENLWHNSEEIPGDGIDNDNNGKGDDYYGWNFEQNSPEYTTGNHGTGVAGIIGAKGDNEIYVSGVNWNVKLMFFQIEYLYQAVESYHYVLQKKRDYLKSNGQKGAFVVATNASFGVSGGTCDEWPEVNEMYDSLGAVGVLSVAATDNDHIDVDERGDMPTDCKSDFLITVTNTTREDKLDATAGYGQTTIDLGAPGDNIITTGQLNRLDENFDGTSASCPHVTGALSLLYTLPCDKFTALSKSAPSQAAALMKDFILNGVDSLPDLENKSVSGGRLNVSNSLKMMELYCGAKTGDLEVEKVYPNPVRTNLYIEYVTPDLNEYDFKVYNVLGQIVLYEKFSPEPFNERKIDFDVSHFSPGIYFIIIEGGTQRKLIKFIKS